MARSLRFPALFPFLLLPLLSSCELQEVTLAEPPVELLVVEGLVQVGLPAPEGGPFSIDRISVFLHRTVQGVDGFNRPEPGALVQVIRSDGVVYRLRELLDPSACVSSTPISGTGTCYLLAASDLNELPALAPGDSLALEVQALDGRVLTGRTVIPGAFELYGPSNEEVCTITADEPFPMAWSQAEGSWAYVAETQMYGLRAALEPRGIEVELDPLFLVGISISARDTTIVFPAQFGVFERFELDREVAQVLQQGLPPSSWAEIVVSAVDRNYVNWVRGGNFNPSGTVRIASVQGDGTGFFGSSMSRWLEVLVNPPPQGGIYAAPRCRLPG